MGTKADRIIGALVAIVSGGLGAWASSMSSPPGWAVGVIAALAVAAGLFRVGVFGTKGAGAFMIFMFLAGSASAGCNPYEAAWRTTAGVQAAATMTDKAIAAAVLADHDKCRNSCGVGNQCYRDCIDSKRSYKALKEWRKHAKPAINGALIATVASLSIAERSKSKPNWLELVKPAACALAKVVEQFGDLMGSKKSAIMVAVAAVKGVSCD